MRLFVAVDPGEQVRAALTPALDAWRAAWDLRWVRPENLHITLRFLGETSPDVVGSLQEALSEAVGGHRAFTVRTGGLDVFPHWRRPRVLFLHLDDAGGLADLAGAVDGAVTRCLGDAVAPAGVFRAHLTLARFRRDPDGDATAAIRALVPPPTPAFPVDAVGLIESRLQPEGTIYGERDRFPLARDGAS